MMPRRRTQAAQHDGTSPETPKGKARLNRGGPGGHLGTSPETPKGKARPTGHAMLLEHIFAHSG
jgi:hypothetical protein